jgi:flagellar biosynthesis protein FlhF
MRLRTFIANTMADAVIQVREAMGDNAIIVSSLEGENGGFEVTAALDTRVASDGVPFSDADASLEDILRTKLNPNNDGNFSEDVPGDAPDEREEDRTNAATSHSGLFFDEDLLISALDEQAVPRPLAEAILADAQSTDTDDAVEALSSALDQRFTFDPLPVAPRHPLLAVGLPGSGKTVTVAKLAARAVLEGALAEIISTDAERTGAKEQSNAYGDLLQITVSHAETVDAMGLVLDHRADRAAIEAADTREACFIDTAAANPFLHASFKTLKRQIDAAQLVAAAEPILILAAGGDPRGMAETTQAFAKLGIERMIVTQVDIARRIGGVMAAAEVSGLSFAQISATPYLARGVVSATPRRFARLILGHRTTAQNESGAVKKSTITS